MMKNYETDDTFLGRWIAGELSEEERIAFEKSESYKQFDLINKESQLLEAPSIDTNAALQKVKARLGKQEKKPKVVSIKRWYAIAATVIILVGLGIFLQSSKTYTTGIGEKMTVTLADGSTVDLNANSTLSHKRFFWDSNKEVSLIGEGYFTVTKGDSFKVHTSQGTIAVLGTQFTIKDRSIFEVKCYEGRIQFTDINDTFTSKILTKGMSISIVDDTLIEDSFEENAPIWKSGTSEFIDQPISVILEELMNYYPITFEYATIDATRLFTGTFTHNNLEKALQATLVPMGITYKKSALENTLILSD
ncbi:FecR family protein [Dokdonia sp.]|uniref:FecR family protein n=1 Tax=Dokdonia sp. TaxID=2024995 RepID=UPI003264C62D